MNFKELINDTKIKIEKRFKEYYKNEETSPFLKEALDELLRMNSGGKCIRGTLIRMGYMASGNNDDKYLDLAMAYELFETSILIHDDIIDESSLRRNKTTIHEKYKEKYKKDDKTDNFNHKLNNISNSMALCIGDYGLFESIKIINNYNNKELLDEFIHIAQNTSKGEMLDIIIPFQEEFFDVKELEKEILNIYELKTACYSILGPYRLGLLLGNMTIDEMNKPLIKIGIAFQIKDDILGIYGNNIGKTTTDIEEYKQTLLYSYAKEQDKDNLKKNYGKKNKEEEIKKLFENTKSLEKAELRMKKLFKEAKEELEDIDLNNDSKELLLELLDYLENRKK